MSVPPEFSRLGTVVRTISSPEVLFPLLEEEGFGILRADAKRQDGVEWRRCKWRRQGSKWPVTNMVLDVRMCEVIDGDSTRVYSRMVAIT